MEVSSCRGEGVSSFPRAHVWVNSEILAPVQIVPMQSKAAVRFYYCFGSKLCTDSQAEPLASAATTHTELPARALISFK